VCVCVFEGLFGGELVAATVDVCMYATYVRVCVCACVRVCVCMRACWVGLFC
jgi:hypothetical protein